MNNYDHTEWCSCGERFTTDEKFCSNCGKERTITAQSSTTSSNTTERCSCGEPFLLDENICHKCGKKRPFKPLVPNNAFIHDPVQNNTSVEKIKSGHPCPLCRKEMEFGHIYTNHPMKWKKSDSKWFSGGQKINDDASGLFHFISGNQLASYRCTSCRIMLINY